MSLCPENLVNTISQIPLKGILPNFGHSVFGFIDVLLGSKGPVSRSQQAMTRKPCEHHISKPVKGILPNFGHVCISVRSAD